MEIKEEKRVIYIIFSVLIALLLISVASAGVFDWLKKITGKATEQQVEMNISIGGPQIILVLNDSFDVSGGPNAWPSGTDVEVNFTVYLTSGAANLNDSSARMNFTKTNEDTRQNLTCANYESSGNYANYTCNITMWWWDGEGAWNITAYIEDNNQNPAQNDTTTFYLGTTTGFVSGPGNLTWPGISPGATNQTSDNDPLLMNNTGNDPIDAPNIEVNSTHLRGETTSSEALWAENFSIGYATGSNEECAAATSTNMSHGGYVGLVTANLTKGNFTINDGYTGQEQLYFCIRIVGSELSSQQYSTSNETEGLWTIKIS